MNQYGLKTSGTSTLIDQLSYTYQTNSNKLAKVADQIGIASEHLGDFQDGSNSGDDYGYDANGNMTSDQNKKISKISYNILNLPSAITVTGKGTIKYYYDATGSKLRKRTTDNILSYGKATVTTYLGNAVYQNDTLQFFGTGEGRVRPNTAKTDWVYDYFLKDHLGNTRMVITDDYNVAAPILEANSYYPFGLQQKGIGVTAVVPNQQNEYLYNGKELQQDLEFDLYDYGARFYDAQIGGWHTVDPLAEKFASMSPYTAMGNNPIIYIDPDGREIVPASQKEWERQKQSVISQRDRLQSRVDNLTAKAADKGWSAEKLAGKIGNMQDRISSLNGTISNLGTLEASSQVYALRSGAGEEGGTTYDPSTGNIVFSYGSTSNFVHETTHGGQFESGDIAFDTKTGMPYGSDVFDEVSAYKAQFGYDPSSVSGLTSSSTVNSFGTITPSWVQGITKSDGSKIYAPGGAANTGIAPVNINTNRAGLIKAYPNQTSVLKNLPATFILKNLPTIYYKK